MAVVFLHSYIFTEHEELVGQLCKSLKGENGLSFAHVSLSSQLTKTVKAVSRGHTATVNAFLTPFLEVRASLVNC